jgi:hypothetical protein
MDLVLEIEKLICLSPKRSHYFLSKKHCMVLHSHLIQDQFGRQGGQLGHLPLNYETLQETLDNKHTTGPDEYSIHAEG